jgi:HTH-type transcriptional regulator / antitoxin HigA
MQVIKIIETEAEYDAALKRIDQLLDIGPEPESLEGRELQLLLVLVEKYEDEHYAIDMPDPIEAIKVRMDDLGMKAKDLIPYIGDKGTVSKVLSRKIHLSINMIRRLSTALHIPAEVLLQEVELKNAS